jgi:hypothetical protein
LGTFECVEGKQSSDYDVIDRHGMEGYS